MSAATRVEEPTVGTVRFGRRGSRGVLLGLSAPRVVALVCAFVVMLPALYVGGGQAVAWTTPLWGTAIASAFVPVAGRRAVEWLPVAGHWALRRALHQNV